MAGDGHTDKYTNTDYLASSMVFFFTKNNGSVEKKRMTTCRRQRMKKANCIGTHTQTQTHADTASSMLTFFSKTKVLKDLKHTHTHKQNNGSWRKSARLLVEDRD